MKITVLDRFSMGNDIDFNKLSEYGELEIYEKTSSGELEERVSSSDIIILNKVKITAEILKNSPKLKLICVFATGYDNIDIKAAAAYGVAVCNVPAYSTESVTLYTVATVLALVTHLKEYNRYVRNGEYTESGIPNKLNPPYHELKGMVWGIIGCGNIGSRVADVAKVLGADVIVNKRTPSEQYRTVDLNTLLKESDIITIHCPLTDATRKMINKNSLNLMRKSVVLVNEARGAVVDESAVAEAVLSGKIGAFGCDVYSEEPFGREHPYNKIKELDNVILTPHSAWAAYESRERCLDIISDNISSFLNGGKLNRIV